MSEEVKPGATAQMEWLVEEQHCIRRGKNDVFSTPNMVRLVEATSAETLKPFLGANQGSVGSRVAVRHLAPTPKGMRVRAMSTIREVDGRRVVFQVEVHDEIEKVGEAEHERFIVDLDRFGGRLQEKLAVLASRNEGR